MFCTESKMVPLGLFQIGVFFSPRWYNTRHQRIFVCFKQNLWLVCILLGGLFKDLFAKTFTPNVWRNDPI